jgi:hypothetical protein
MSESITTYILTRLSGASSEDEIIYSVCQKTGLGWKDAQTLVEQVRDDNQIEIETRQIPIKSGLSLIFFALGVILTIGTLINLWIMLDVTSTFLVFVSNGFNASTETAIKLLASRCVLLGWFELPSIIFTFMVGITICIANIQYMRGAWGRIFR